jgi:hypothetical protein
MRQETLPTYTAAIYIAGDLDTARATCRHFCMSGLCVTLESVEFIYTGGAETGVRVGLINYPRFPAEPADIFAKAEALADRLMNDLCQHSYSIVATDKTVWKSRRPESQ